MKRSPGVCEKLCNVYNIYSGGKGNRKRGNKVHSMSHPSILLFSNRLNFILNCFFYQFYSKVRQASCSIRFSNLTCAFILIFHTWGFIKIQKREAPRYKSQHGRDSDGTFR